MNIAKETNKNETTNIVFNYSDIDLDENMTKVLNRRLRLSVQPPSIDVTQVLVDYKKFERVMIWKEYWHNKDSEESSDKKRNIEIEIA